MVDSRKIAGVLALAILSRPLKAEEFHSVATPIVALGVIIALLYWARVFFITSIVAVIIAFILEPFVGLLMRIRFPRSVASFVVCSMALMLIYLAGLGVYTQLAGLWAELPKFSQRITELIEGVRRKADDLESSTYRMIVPARQRQQQQAQPAAPPPQSSRRKKSPPPPETDSPIPGLVLG